MRINFLYQETGTYTCMQEYVLNTNGHTDTESVLATATSYGLNRTIQRHSKNVRHVCGETDQKRKGSFREGNIHQTLKEPLSTPMMRSIYINVTRVLLTGSMEHRAGV